MKNKNKHFMGKEKEKTWFNGHVVKASFACNTAVSLSG